MSELLNLIVRDHLLIAVLLGLLFLFILPLGVLHALRIFGRFFVVTIEEFEHEFAGIRKVVGEIRSKFRIRSDDD